MIVDTGILFALADRSDRHHRAAAAVFALPDVRILPEPVVVETDRLILRYLGVEARDRVPASTGRRNVRDRVTDRR